MINLEQELKSHFQVLSLPDSDGATISFRPPSTLAYFQGHFPGLPVLPAVGIADISHYFLQEFILKKKAGLKALSFFKVRTPVQPTGSFLIKIQPEGTKYYVTWSKAEDGSLCAEMNLELTN